MEHTKFSTDNAEILLNMVCGSSRCLVLHMPFLYHFPHLPVFLVRMRSATGSHRNSFEQLTVEFFHRISALFSPFTESALSYFLLSYIGSNLHLGQVYYCDVLSVNYFSSGSAATYRLGISSFQYCNRSKKLTT